MKVAIVAMAWLCQAITQANCWRDNWTGSKYTAEPYVLFR
jgi:hypothetical protein